MEPTASTRSETAPHELKLPYNENTSIRYRAVVDGNITTEAIDCPAPAPGPSATTRCTNLSAALALGENDKTAVSTAMHATAKTDRRMLPCRRRSPSARIVLTCPPTCFVEPTITNPSWTLTGRICTTDLGATRNNSERRPGLATSWRA